MWWNCRARRSLKIDCWFGKVYHLIIIGCLWLFLLKPKTGDDKWYEIHRHSRCHSKEISEHHVTYASECNQSGAKINEVCSTEFKFPTKSANKMTAIWITVTTGCWNFMQVFLEAVSCNVNGLFKQILTLLLNNFVNSIHSNYDGAWQGNIWVLIFHLISAYF